MRVTCEHCQAGYTLPDRKLKPGRRVQFECRKCGQRIVVQVPAKLHGGAAEVLWFVAQPAGGYAKYSDTHVRQAIQHATLPPETLVWTKGQSEWMAVSKLPMWSELRSGVANHQQNDDAPKTAILAPEAQDLKGSKGVAGSRRAQSKDIGASKGTDQDSIVGASNPSTDQKAMSLPIVDAAPLTTELGRKAQIAKEASKSETEIATQVASPQAVQTKISAKASRLSMGSSSQSKAERFAPGASPTGTPVDTGGAIRDDNADSAAWSPATDTYIGPRDRHTFRIGSDKERQSLIAYVELETSLRRQIRKWQWVTLAASAVAAIAIALALYGWMTMREAKADLRECETSQAASPSTK